MKTNNKSLEEEIALVKESITKVGHMHPGTLSVQKRTGDRK